MQRYKITIEYDGRPYVGWQAQDNGPSVQETIETAIHAFCGERVRITSAGRTDAGVHATAMVADFVIERATTAKEVFGALNYHLRGEAIAILNAEPVPDDFSARHSARRRHYTYRIVNRRAPLALDKGRAWQVIAPLDANAMNAAAQRLVGKHDFTTFRHVHCQARSPIKTVDFLCVERAGDEVYLHAAARSFLHHQIRSFMGTLKLVGQGRWSADDVSSALAARDRQALGMNAPPDGLYFTGVDY